MPGKKKKATQNVFIIIAKTRIKHITTKPLLEISRETGFKIPTLAEFN
jgi:hypothetical protein